MNGTGIAIKVTGFRHGQKILQLSNLHGIIPPSSIVYRKNQLYLL